jgi:CRISPR-associated protein Csb2
LRFLNDRYHGSEWPPSPGRLFQALVAGGKVGAPIRDWNAQWENALSWLEALGAPDIMMRRGYAGHAYTTYVPNNSLDRDGYSTKTSKQVASTILHDHVPGQPDLVYHWKVPDIHTASAHLPALDQVAARLRALGWGIDFATASVCLDQNPEHPEGLELLIPAANGPIAMRVPVSGLLAHLGRCHTAFKARISKQGISPYTRPTRFATVRYHRAHSWCPHRFVAFELRNLEDSTFAARWDQTAVIAAWLRHAAGQALRQEEIEQSWIDSYVLGHTGPNDLGNRLSFVPLPSVGHQHSDGGIRRVLIIEPPAAARDAKDAEGLDLLSIKLPGWVLTDTDNAKRAVLAPLERERSVLPLYTAQAKVWRTVTPVILHGYNRDRRRISLTKTDRLLLQAFELAGLPEGMIESVSFQAAPYWPGSEASSAIRVPRHLIHWPRLHVSVAFTERIQGPVLAGIGRHYGIGVFAAKC